MAVMPLAATSTEQLWFLNTLVTVRVRHDEGEDGISVLESLAPHGDSPPLHVHQTEDETFHVLEGELRVRAGDADVTIAAGETLLAPKRVAHTYRVESPAGARWLGAWVSNNDSQQGASEWASPALSAASPF
jgi:quercetin dioxygenase-like cupin family protein